MPHGNSRSDVEKLRDELHVFELRFAEFETYVKNIACTMSKELDAVERRFIVFKDYVEGKVDRCEISRPFDLEAIEAPPKRAHHKKNWKTAR